MLDRDAMLSIADEALDASSADQTEVAVAASDSALTRFAGNAIHQNVFEADVAVTMRAVMGKRIGVASTNDPSSGALRDLAGRALELARNAAPDDDFVSLPAPADDGPRCETAPVAATARCGPEERAARVGQIIAAAQANSLTAAGRFSTGQAAYCIVNSPGIRAHFARSDADCTVVMQGDSSSGFAQAQAEDVGEIDAQSLATVAAEKTLASTRPVALEPGEYTVILETPAVRGMIGMLGMYDLHALAHQEGRSFTTGRMGHRVCGENITILDDGCDARTSRLPFDFEGIPRRRVDIITGGVLAALPYDSYTAGREEGARNTGHALPAPNTWGPVPLNLIMLPGEHTLEEMIAATDRGVLVTRFHYTNMVHPVRTVFTGMTRDGTFLIEGGKIAGGVKNMRFTQSILEALSRVDMIGCEGTVGDRAWAPPVRIEGFNFSSATEF